MRKIVGKSNKVGAIHQHAHHYSKVVFVGYNFTQLSATMTSCDIEIFLLYARKGWHTRRFSVLRAIFMTGVGDAIPEASYPFGTILRRIACVPYITLNRLHYLRGLRNISRGAARLRWSPLGIFFRVRQLYQLFAFSHFKEDHIGASTAVGTFT